MTRKGFLGGIAASAIAGLGRAKAALPFRLGETRLFRVGKMENR